jgi:hypothetical protein
MGTCSPHTPADCGLEESLIISYFFWYSKFLKPEKKCNIWILELITQHYRSKNIKNRQITQSIQVLGGFPAIRYFFIKELFSM